MTPLIVGGGPAGSAAAVALARGGVRATLLERTRETGDALCGGFLSWRTLETLAALGIEPDALNPARIVRARVFAGGSRAVEAPLPFAALVVSRHRLDTVLLRTAERAGAGVERGVGVRSAGGVAVRLADGASLTGDALFLATGKHELRGLARPAGAAGDDPALGLRVRLRLSARLAAACRDAIELHLFDRGYAGLVVQEDGSANLCLAVRRSRFHEAGATPDALLAAIGQELPAFADRLACRDGSRADAVANVPYGWRATTGCEALFRLGDQAGVIPSLAGEGMGIAVASGASAAGAYLAGGPRGAARWQPRFAAATRRPILLAGLLRDLAESRTARPALPWLARAGLLGMAARATRLSAQVASRDFSLPLGERVVSA